MSNTPANTGAAAAAAGHDSHGGGGGGGQHVLPVKVYMGVWLALMALTAITVAAAQYDFGGLNIWIAMLIATIKASLVVLFFMHLAFDRMVYATTLIASLLLVSLFISLTMMDTHQYSKQIRTDFENSWDKAAQEAKTPTPK